MWKGRGHCYPGQVADRHPQGVPGATLTFQIDGSSFGIQIFSENGKYSIVGYDGEDYPEVPVADEDAVTTMAVSRQVLLKGLRRPFSPPPTTNSDR